ncbi:hypothetical protein F4775DRAFT_449751 [Biscogniauxia sp. FL1348]|nr:hypothetical protein F4775DRAFT_449751 [Biscogniauxia sp. FL1348]
MAILSYLESLPDEILLQILSFVESRDVVKLQFLSKRFLRLCRDGNLWRNRCLSASALHERVQLYRWGSDWVDEGGTSLSNTRALSGQGNQPEDQSDLHWSLVENLSLLGSKKREREHIRIAANWDRTFDSEGISWYDEYIHRNGPIAVSWFEQPQLKDGSTTNTIDVSGVALYNPSSVGHELFAVSPLDDGSVCLWDVKGTRGRKGSILSKSGAGILCSDGPGTDLSKRSNMINIGVTECVSIDNHRHRAYFAVQSHLIEVDLETLAVVGNQPFEWSITTLSRADPGFPLTVGTFHGLHLHDHRASHRYRTDYGERLDHGTQRNGLDFSRVLDDSNPLPPYASLAQSGPQSILHLERPGDKSQLSDDIFVAGRFSSILHYDRRMFPAIKGSIHSGARLCSLASLPYPFSSVDSDLRRRFQLSEEQVQKGKAVVGGRTLIAGGEYNTKGSLEIYGLSSGPDDLPRSRVSHDSTMKNRQTASKSKLLSVINHGSRIVFSDGQGYLKWVERDGFTEVRHYRIGKSEKVVQRSLFGSMPGSDEIARKLLSTQTGQDSNALANNDDILFWTGEKLGILGFSSKPGFSADDFEETTRTPEEIAIENEGKLHSERMRLALERQANEVHFVQSLGAGSIRNAI